MQQGTASVSLLSESLLCALPSVDGGMTLWDAASATEHATITPMTSGPFALTAKASSVTPSVSMFETPNLRRILSGDRLALVAGNDASGAPVVVVVQVNTMAVEWSVVVGGGASPKKGSKGGAERVAELVLVSAELLLIRCESGRVFSASRSPLPTKSGFNAAGDSDEEGADDDVVAAKQAKAAATSSAARTEVSVSVAEWSKKCAAIAIRTPEEAVAVAANGEVSLVNVANGSDISGPWASGVSADVAGLRLVSASDSEEGATYAVVWSNSAVRAISVVGAAAGEVTAVTDADASAQRVISAEALDDNTVCVVLETVAKKGGESIQILQYVTMVPGGASEASPSKKGGRKSGTVKTSQFEAMPAEPVELSSGESVVAMRFDPGFNGHVLVVGVNGTLLRGTVSMQNGCPGTEQVLSARWAPMIRLSAEANNATSSATASSQPSATDNTTAAVRFAYPITSGSATFLVTVLAKHSVHTTCNKLMKPKLVIRDVIEKAVASNNDELIGVIATTAWNPISLRAALRTLTAIEAKAVFSSVVRLIDSFSAAAVAAGAATDASFIRVMTNGVETATALITLQRVLGFTLDEAECRKFYAAVRSVRSVSSSWAASGIRLEALQRAAGKKAVSSSSVKGIKAQEETATNMKASQLKFKTRYSRGGGSLDFTLDSLLEELPSELQASDSVMGKKTNKAVTQAGADWVALGCRSSGSHFVDVYEAPMLQQQ